MATEGILTGDGGVNTAHLSGALQHLYDSYQRLIKSPRVPREAITLTQGFARINREKTFLYVPIICTVSDQYRPENERKQDVLKDIPYIKRLDESGGQVDPRRWNPMMIGGSEPRTQPLVLNQTFTAMTCVLSVHHQAGKLPFRYPWTLFVGPGTIPTGETSGAIVGSMSRSSSRVIFSEATTDGVAYGAIAYLTRTFPRRATLFVFLPAKQDTTRENSQPMSVMTPDAIAGAIGAAIARWSTISRAVFRDDPPTLANEAALRGKDSLFVKHTASGAPVSVWFPLVRFSVESDTFQILMEDDDTSRTVERAGVSGVVFEGADSMDDDLSAILPVYMSRMDKAHYRWVRSILYLRLIPYFLARSNTPGTLPRASVFTELDTREILRVNGKGTALGIVEA